MVKKETTKTS